MAIARRCYVPHSGAATYQTLSKSTLPRFVKFMAKTQITNLLKNCWGHPENTLRSKRWQIERDICHCLFVKPCQRTLWVELADPALELGLYSYKIQTTEKFKVNNHTQRCLFADRAVECLNGYPSFARNNILTSMLALYGTTWTYARLTRLRCIQKKILAGICFGPGAFWNRTFLKTRLMRA